MAVSPTVLCHTPPSPSVITPQMNALPSDPPLPVLVDEILASVLQGSRLSTKSVECLLNQYHCLLPVGKNLPPPKHACSPSTPCPIHFSDVGKQYHTFLKGTFKARFSPPVLPKFILKHFAANPPVWTWSIKDGPNKGKSFQVPTIPVASNKSAPKAVQWTVVMFHSFKAHLNPIAINIETGRVHQAWLHLYQNNMYVHLQSQLKMTHHAASTHPPAPSPSPKGPNCPNPSPMAGPSPSSDVIAELKAKISSLHEKLYNFVASHEACCLQCSNPSPSPPSESDSEEESTHPSPSIPPFTLLKMGSEGPFPDPHPPSWLTTVLSREDIPPYFKGMLYSPS
ncbi:hypothetical protein EDC04DRAFT_2895096 [Pisolithus marmoratus]|nr:hypothetical protein EDC04DRAFT_2895096 [Pisolithus marmoratus]